MVECRARSRLTQSLTAAGLLAVCLTVGLAVTPFAVTPSLGQLPLAGPLLAEGQPGVDGLPSVVQETETATAAGSGGTSSGTLAWWTRWQDTPEILQRLQDTRGQRSQRELDAIRERRVGNYEREHRNVLRELQPVVTTAQASTFEVINPTYWAAMGMVLTQIEQ
jgi:hypothetical protein